MATAGLIPNVCFFSNNEEVGGGGGGQMELGVRGGDKKGGVEGARKRRGKKRTIGHSPKVTWTRSFVLLGRNVM